MVVYVNRLCVYIHTLKDARTQYNGILYVHIYVFIYVCIYVYINVYGSLYIRTCIHIYICIYIYIYAHSLALPPFVSLSLAIHTLLTVTGQRAAFCERCSQESRTACLGISFPLE